MLALMWGLAGGPEPLRLGILLAPLPSFTLIPDCGCVVTGCLMLLLFCLPHHDGPYTLQRRADALSLELLLSVSGHTDETSSHPRSTQKASQLEDVLAALFVFPHMTVSI